MNPETVTPMPYHANGHTALQRVFRPVKRYLPRWIHEPIRRVATAVLVPVIACVRSGHVRSTFVARAVARDGSPVPWYVYPAIDFLRTRDYRGRTVLEFGAGQSTLWWAARAERVVALETPGPWYSSLCRTIPDNVRLCQVTDRDARLCVSSVRHALMHPALPRLYSVVVIDGLWRAEMVPIALERVAPDGAIIVDNAEGYGIHEAMMGRGFLRVDFVGHAPGVVLRHVTSMFFRPSCFLVHERNPIHVEYL